MSFSSSPVKEDSSSAASRKQASSSESNLVSLSKHKLQAVAQSLSTCVCFSADAVLEDGGGIQQLPCATMEDAVGYRCRCSFQIVWSDNGNGHYAVRENGAPVITDFFPVANTRIQQAMAKFLMILNADCEGNPKATTQGTLPTSSVKTCLVNQLTSISFSSSWCDDNLGGDISDCFLTLHYGKPIEDIAAWKVEAEKVCIALDLAQLTARSRKRTTLALEKVDNVFIRDTVWMRQSESQSSKWTISVKRPKDANLTNCEKVYAVHYEKPEGAFFHPNATAMCHALEWMLLRISVITANGSDCKRMLEMYCGCGAHTVALSKSGLLDKIVAVEYDVRLVQACHRNISLNQSHAVDDSRKPTPIEIVLANAAVWAQGKHHGSNDFDILRVDPPRQGLDDCVCQMAIDGPFQHILYISCGHEALLRDLALLSSDFRVANCTLLDLFPQTHAVESLVHLERKRR